MPVDRDALLQGLNPDQLEAVTHGDGPLLVVAGAGSGKTRVLTRRVAWLIAERGVSPFSILAITFTNKAADEMRHRVGALVGPVADKMWVSTFHSACVRMLRRDAHRLGFTNRFTIYDQTDAQRLVGYVVRDKNLDPKKLPPRSLHAAISAAKNEGKLPEALEVEARTVYDRKLIEVYREYQQRLLAASAMDFDDLLLQTVRLLTRCPDVLESYQHRFRHLLVDEFQDTNHVQNELVILLGQQSHNVTVVGDSDQSIYRFRRADIRNILEFEQAFPDVTVVTLAQNYRSTQIILDAANAVISNNAARKPKELWSDAGKGEAIVRYTADDEHDEAAWVADTLARLHRDEHERWGDMAVFFRTNAQSRAVEEALTGRRIPYKVVGGTRFYDRKEIKDLLSYLRAVRNPADEVSLKRIANVPRRGVGDTSLAKLDAFAASKGVSFGDAIDRAEEAGISGKALTGLRQVRALLDELRQLAEGRATLAGEAVDVATGELGLDLGAAQPGQAPAPPAQLLEEILKRTGYLAELEAEMTIEAEGRVENIAELVGLAGQFEQLDAFLEATALVSDQDEVDGDSSQVLLMTIHTAKGLEFDVVTIIGLEDGVFPHLRSLSEPDELEEERRLAYVALTRARRRLFLTNAWSRSLWGSTQYNPVSRFVKEIPTGLVTVAPGSRGAGSGRADDDRVRVWGAGNGSGMGSSSELGQSVRDRVVEAALRSGRGLGPTRAAGGAPLDVKPGDDVVHGKWGEGVVLDVDTRRGEAMIRFPGIGDKLLDLSIAPLKKA
jgi:DNA helicase-2/ATP-dependent DNA helicase PcrA